MLSTLSLATKTLNIQYSGGSMNLIKQSLIVISLLITGLNCFANEKKAFEKNFEIKDNNINNKVIIDVLKNKRLVDEKAIASGTKTEWMAMSKPTSKAQ